MKTIWKVQLIITGRQTIALPKDSVILTVQVQREWIRLWALADTEKEPEERHIRIIGTGNPIAEDGKEVLAYIGTCQQFNGELVWHVFEARDKEKVKFDNQATIHNDSVVELKGG